MGFFRFYLAIVVIISHCPQGSIFIRFSHPALAVQCFYAISGFYMQLLVIEFKKNSYHWVRDFYLNRVIRLYPTYLFILAVTFLLLPEKFGYLHTASFNQSIAFLFNNIFIITQDPLRFFNSEITVLPQSWTISLEMMFYILAPFLLFTSNRVFFLCTIASVICRLMLCQYDLYLGHWFYEFFPSEIGIFLLGSLGYRFYQRYLLTNFYIPQYILKIISAIVFYYLIYFTLFGWVNVVGGNWDEKATLGVPIRYWAVLALSIVSLPFIFHLTKNLKIDRYIGEYSYPMYLSHFTIIFLIQNRVAAQYQNIVVVALTIIFSLFVVHAIELPLSRLRQSIKRNNKMSLSGNEELGDLSAGTAK